MSSIKQNNTVAKADENKEAKTSYKDVLQAANKKPSNNKPKSKKQDLTKKPKFQGGTKGLEDHIFIYGRGMSEKWLISKEKLLNYIGKTYTMSEARSMDKGYPILIGVEKPLEHTEAEFNALSFFDKEAWKIQLKKYMEAEATLKRNLSSCYAILWGQMTITLRNKVKQEKSYKEIHDNLDAPKLFNLVTYVCNQAQTVDHYPSRCVESLIGLINLPGNNLTLSEYYEMFVQRVKASKLAGVDFFSTNLAGHLLKQKADELGTMNHPDYRTFRGQVSKHCNDVITAMIFLRGAGDRYEECRRNMNNDFVMGTDHMPKTVDEAYAVLQNFELTPQYSKNNNRNTNKKNQQKPDGNEKHKDQHSFQQQDFP